MKKAVVALAVILGSATTAYADQYTTIVASPPGSSVVGQTVTFTAMFTHYCSDGVDSAIFVVDGAPHLVPWSGDPRATSTFAISTLSVGTHSVSFKWTASQPGTSTTCKGDASLPSYVVKPRPAPAPASSPKPPPSPAASAVPSPSAVESPTGPPSPSPASPTRVTGTTVADHSRSPGLPLVAGIGVLVMLIAAATLIGLRLRRLPGG